MPLEKVLKSSLRIVYKLLPRSIEYSTIYINIVIYSYDWIDATTTLVTSEILNTLQAISNDSFSI